MHLVGENLKLQSVEKTLIIWIANLSNAVEKREAEKKMTFCLKNRKKSFLTLWTREEEKEVVSINEGKDIKEEL